VTELVNTLSSGTGNAAVYARTLASLARNRGIRITVIAHEALLPLISALSSEHAQVLAAAANALSIITSHWLDVNTRSQCKVAGGILPLVLGLSATDTHAQAACCRALASIAKESDTRALVTQYRGVEHVARLLRCATDRRVQIGAAECITAGETCTTIVVYVCACENMCVRVYVCMYVYTHPHIRILFATCVPCSCCFSQAVHHAQLNIYALYECKFSK
jgi:hypothetical protein